MAIKIYIYLPDIGHRHGSKHLCNPLSCIIWFDLVVDVVQMEKDSEGRAVLKLYGLRLPTLNSIQGKS